MLFGDLLAVDSLTALNFFYSNLKEEATDEPVNHTETVYVASVLASYAQTSRFDSSSIPPFTTLSEVFDHFVLRATAETDPGLLEIAGAQSLFLNGFFRDQMRARHNVEWYDQLGTAFYERAMRYAEERERRELYGRLASHFTVWTAVCHRLHRTLREQHLILRG
jgi:hypothetical protein